MIDVELTSEGDPLRFKVVVREGARETRHEVSMARATYEKLAQGTASPQALVDAAFRFLLDREAPSSILPRFDVTLISHYFPEFEQALAGYLPRRRD